MVRCLMILESTLLNFYFVLGLLLYVTSFVMNGLPYFVYGSGRDALSNTLEYSSIFALNDTQETQFNTKMKDLCYANSK